MRIKKTDVTVERDDGTEAGYINDENEFCPKSGLTFHTDELKFILELMGVSLTKKRRSTRKPANGNGKVRRRSKVVLGYVKQIAAGKYKQVEVAKASNVDQGTLSSILTARTLKPNQKILNKIRLGLNKLDKAA